MIVMKFGGTSVEDAAAMRRVAAIVRREIHRSPLVVVSACAGVTNALVRVAEHARSRDLRTALQSIREIRRRHERIAIDLLTTRRTARAGRRIGALASELEVLARGVAALGELTPRSQDAFLSYGELFSSLLLQEYFAQIRLRSRLVNARRFMTTDGAHTKAAPLRPAISRALRKAVRPSLGRGRVVLTQGFLGATEEGVPTTLGRGGSDFSASYLGSILGAREIQIWTDVDGILTADPSIVKQARNIATLSFREASELAYFGARVLHPDTILPAIRKKIPVLVLNSRKPDWPGTRVLPQRARNGHGSVRSIAYKERVTVLNIISTRMFLAHGFLEKVFDLFDRHRTVVHTVATSDVSITAVIDDRSHLEALVRELRTFASVAVSGGKAIICVVGEGLRHSPGMAARVLGAVGDVDINMISAGASEINISLVVAEEAIPIAVRRLHAEFFPAHPGK